MIKVGKKVRIDKAVTRLDMAADDEQPDSEYHHPHLEEFYRVLKQKLKKISK